MPTYQMGHFVESMVASYLQQAGLRLLHRNFRCRLGEIDLVVEDRRYLIFVEVRYRATGHFGGPLASVTWQKQKTIRRVAQWYLKRFSHCQNRFCRFDVVGVSRVTAESAEFDWIQNAF